jgi:hypothetical protein
MNEEVLQALYFTLTLSIELCAKFDVDCNSKCTGKDGNVYTLKEKIEEAVDVFTRATNG